MRRFQYELHKLNRAKIQAKIANLPDNHFSKWLTEWLAWQDKLAANFITYFRSDLKLSKSQQHKLNKLKRKT